MRKIAVILSARRRKIIAPLPGLYGLSAEVEFSDFQAADYADNTDALKAIISEYAYNVSVTAGDGGFVTVDKTALRKGDSLTVTVTPNAGFVLSSFKVNGVDRYDYVVNNLAAGKVTFADIEADSAIEATFARLSGGVRVTGGTIKAVPLTITSDASDNFKTVYTKLDISILNATINANLTKYAKESQNTKEGMPTPDNATYKWSSYHA